MTNNNCIEQQNLGLNLSTRRTREEMLLDEMVQVMPWIELVALIAAHAPTGKAGHPRQGGASVSGDQAPIRLHHDAFSGNEEEHGATDQTVCAVQCLDGQTGAYAKNMGMSSSANLQGVANRVENTAMKPLESAIGADASSDKTCADH